MSAETAAAADASADATPNNRALHGPRLVNQTTGCVLAARVLVAASFWARFVGWMGRREIPPDTALGLTPCDWVHTFFVFAPLDVVYCDRAGLVLRIVPGLKPWRFGPRVPGARTVWEAAAGTFAARISSGDIAAAVPAADASAEGDGA
jgi:uncharacterized protein